MRTSRPSLVNGIISLGNPVAQWDTRNRTLVSPTTDQELWERRVSHKTVAKIFLDKKTIDENVRVSDVQGGALTPRDIYSSTRVLILSSEVDRVFCAGADLKERRSMSHAETKEFLSKLRSTFGKLALLPIPTISAISGFALGGGLELALATTFRVLSTRAKVGLPETRLGIIPGAGGPRRLQDRIGKTKAADMILTGRQIGGQEAFALGLCERLVEEEETYHEQLSSLERNNDVVLDAAMKMANDICEGAPVAIGAAYRTVGQGSGNRGPKVEWEDIMYDRVLQTRDRDEALLAFKEKRKPSFKGL